MPRKYVKLHSLSNEHTDRISSVAFSPSGSLIATGGLDGKAAVWRVDGGELLYVWEGESAILSLVWMNRQDESILCGMQDGNFAVMRVGAVCCCPPTL